MVSPFNVACLQGGPMRVLQTVLALLLMLVLGYATTSPVSAVTIEESASGDLIATLDKARDVREQADIKIRENLKLMASSCLYMLSLIHI